jgi:Phosphotransferase enzyme family
LESLIPFAVKQEWNKGPFVLCHDDLNVQNILVDPATGHITAILDWDYASVKPLQSLLAYPESLRWDILDPYYHRFSEYQQQWSQCYRPLWHDALMFAAESINTGIHIEASKLAEMLEDSTFYAELERGLSESWRESEAMMFCNGYVYGDLSRDVLESAGRGITAGTWMTTHGTRAGFKAPKQKQSSNCKRSNFVAKVKASIKKKKASVHEGGVSAKPKKGYSWTSFREKVRQRRKTRKVVEALCEKSDEDNQELNPRPRVIEKKTPVRKRGGWWTFLFRRFYARKERTVMLE